LVSSPNLENKPFPSKVRHSLVAESLSFGRTLAMATTSHGRGFARNHNTVHHNHNYGETQSINYGRDQYINNGGQINQYHTTIASRELLVTSLYIVRPNPPRYSNS